MGDEPCVRRSYCLGAQGLPKARTQCRGASASCGAGRMGALAAAAGKRNADLTPRRADFAGGTGARLQALAGPFCPRLPTDDRQAAAPLADGAADREGKAAARRHFAVVGPDRSELRLCRTKPFHSGLRPAGPIEPRPIAPSLAQRPGRGVISAEALSDAAVACQRLLRRISQAPDCSFKNARRPRLTSVTSHVLAGALV